MKDIGELRKFGMVMAAALAAISVLLVLRGRPAWVYTVGASGLLLLAGMAVPRLLAPVERVWMKFAHVLGFIMTNVLLTVVFFTGVTLTGLVMRLLGKRPLNLDIREDDDTYWMDVDPEGPCGRPDKPY
jgi:hypothetical protein